MANTAQIGSSHSAQPNDLFFNCENCGVELVIDRSAAGLTLPCQSCGKPTRVPVQDSSVKSRSNTGVTAEEKAAELQRHLKENQSQRTEINGYINQLNIQLHRWQLRLQTLNERNHDLKNELEKIGATNALRVS